MPDGEDWLWRPVERHMCRYESVIDGTLSLADIAVMNDLIDARLENEARAQEAAERDGKR